MNALKILLAVMATFFLPHFSATSNAQNDELEDLSMKIEAQRQGLDSIDEMMADLDSISKSLDRMIEKTTKDLQDENMKQFQEQNIRNLEAFMAEQNARNEQQKKRLWIRGGVLLVLVITMVYNFIRHRRAKREAA